MTYDWRPTNNPRVQVAEVKIDYAALARDARAKARSERIKAEDFRPDPIVVHQPVMTGGVAGYAARYQRPLVVGLVRCGCCGKDLVPRNDGSPWSHKCDGAHNWLMARRLFGTPGEAAAWALGKLADLPTQQGIAGTDAAPA